MKARVTITTKKGDSKSYPGSFKKVRSDFSGEFEIQDLLDWAKHTGEEACGTLIRMGQPVEVVAWVEVVD
jgi:hypothetical protein